MMTLLFMWVCGFAVGFAWGRNSHRLSSEHAAGRSRGGATDGSSDWLGVSASETQPIAERKQLAVRGDAAGQAASQRPAARCRHIGYCCIEDRVGCRGPDCSDYSPPDKLAVTPNKTLHAHSEREAGGM